MNLSLLNKKLLMVDLDGTIRTTVSNEEFIGNNSMDQQIIPQAYNALKNFQNAGLKIIGITNQGGVFYGYKTLQSAYCEQMITIINCDLLDTIFWCPDLGDTCIQTFKHGELINISHQKYLLNEQINLGKISETFNFRKPSSGMLQLAMTEAGNYGVAECLYTGDREEDRQAAKALDMDFLEVQEFYEFW